MVCLSSCPGVQLRAARTPLSSESLSVRFFRALLLSTALVMRRINQIPVFAIGTVCSCSYPRNHVIEVVSQKFRSDFQVEIRSVLNGDQRCSKISSTFRGQGVKLAPDCVSFLAKVVTRGWSGRSKSQCYPGSVQRPHSNIAGCVLSLRAVCIRPISQIGRL